MEQKRYNFIIALLALIILFNCSSDDSDANNNQNGDNNSPSGSGLTLISQAAIGGSGDEFGIDIIATSTGYVISGVNDLERPYLIGTDTSFQVVWEQNLGTFGVGGFEKIIQTMDGNFAAAGFTQNGNDDVDFDFYLVKFDSSGNIIWEKTFGLSYVTDTTIDLIETSNGDLVIAGSKLTEPLPSNIFNTTQDIVLVKTDSDGNLIWSQIYGEDGNESLASIIEESSGNILIGGSKVDVAFDDNGNIDQFLPGDVKLIRIGSEGNIIQETSLGSPEADGSARIHQLSNGTIVVLASSSGSGDDVTGAISGESDVWIFTLNNSLGISQQATIGGVGRDSAVQLIEDNNGELFLVGDSNSNTVDAINPFSSPDYWIVKLSSNFSVLDEIYLGGSDFDAADAAIYDDGQLIVVGSTVSNDGDVEGNNGSWDIWITAIDDLD